MTAVSPSLVSSTILALGKTENGSWDSETFQTNIRHFQASMPLMIEILSQCQHLLQAQYPNLEQNDE
jgi:hypothetical protein